MTFTLTEGAVAPTKSSNGNWRAVLITPGKGSSGIYSESMLRESGPAAFPKGTHSYIDHPTSEGEIRSPKNLMGVLAEDAHYEDGVGLVAELSVMPHWKAFAEAVAPHTGLSIYAMGEGSYNEDGDMVVESLTPHPQVSVDLVSYAGRPGSGLAEKLYESALAAFSTEGTAATAETEIPTEEGNPNMEEILAKLEELSTKLTALADTLTAPEDAPAEVVPTDVNAVAEAVAEAMVASDLPEVSRKAVYESLRNGGNVTEAIEAQRAFVESVKLHLAESVIPAATIEEAVVVPTVESKLKLSDILKIKVG